MKTIETEGKTVEEAVTTGLKLLNLSREQASVEVLQESSAGFLGLGGKPARVKLTETRGGASSFDAAAACRETDALLGDLLSLMGFDAKSSPAVWDGVQERVRCCVNGTDAQRLVAGDGRALEALQFLVTLIIGRKTGAPAAVQVDALGYWDKREQSILDLALSGVAAVQSTGKPHRLQPMEPAMRRLIHRHLMDNPDVETSSEGEGAWRKIVIRPRKR